jgi:hypothetical protein
MKTTKHTARKTFKVFGYLALAGVGAALAAGQDDIRRFYRMRSM